MKVIYSKYNRHRLPEFQINSRIVKDSNGLVLEKSALDGRSERHLKNIGDRVGLLGKTLITVKLPKLLRREKRDLAFEYVGGESYSELILSSWRGKNAEKFLGLFDEYVGIVEKGFAHSPKVVWTEDFQKIYGDNPFGDNQKSFADVTNLDAIPKNLIRSNDGVYLIDNEWVFKGGLPVKFIIYRAIDDEYNNQGGVLNELVKIDVLFGRYGIPRDEASLFARMEKKFQEYVCGRAGHWTSNYRKPRFGVSYEMSGFYASRSWRLVGVFAVPAARALQKPKKAFASLKAKMSNLLARFAGPAKKAP